jgi:hypothetical protein
MENHDPHENQHVGPINFGFWITDFGLRPRVAPLWHQNVHAHRSAVYDILETTEAEKWNFKWQKADVKWQMGRGRKLEICSLTFAI